MVCILRESLHSCIHSPLCQNSFILFPGNFLITLEVWTQDLIQQSFKVHVLPSICSLSGHVREYSRQSENALWSSISAVFGPSWSKTGSKPERNVILGQLLLFSLAFA